MTAELYAMMHEPFWQFIGGGTAVWIGLDIYFRRRGWL